MTGKTKLVAPKAANPPPAPRTPAASFDIPEGLLSSDLGLMQNRTCNAWAMDRVLGHLGTHQVEIIDGVAMSTEGRYCELVRTGDKLHLFDKL
jgi:hypothetical protein